MHRRPAALRLLLAAPRAPPPDRVVRCFPPLGARPTAAPLNTGSDSNACVSHANQSKSRKQRMHSWRIINSQTIQKSSTRSWSIPPTRSFVRLWDKSPPCSCRGVYRGPLYWKIASRISTPVSEMDLHDPTSKGFKAKSMLKKAILNVSFGLLAPRTIKPPHKKPKCSQPHHDAQGHHRL